MLNPHFIYRKTPIRRCFVHTTMTDNPPKTNAFGSFISEKRRGNELWRGYKGKLRNSKIVVVKHEKHGGSWEQTDIQSMGIDRIYFNSWRD